MGGYVSKFSGRLRVHLINGKGYVVIDDQAQSLTDPTPHRLIAEGLRAKLQREANAQVGARLKRGKRPCLCCSAVFTSEGIHNRLCNDCRADPAQTNMRNNLQRRG